MELLWAYSWHPSDFFNSTTASKSTVNRTSNQQVNLSQCINKHTLTRQHNLNIKTHITGYGSTNSPDSAAATQGISVFIDQLFLVCGFVNSWHACFVLPKTVSGCLFYHTHYLFITCYAFWKASCYLDCCSICITTIIICAYLIRIVISVIWVTGSFSSLSCDLTR